MLNSFKLFTLFFAIFFLFCHCRFILFIERMPRHANRRSSRSSKFVKCNLIFGFFGWNRKSFFFISSPRIFIPHISHVENCVCVWVSECGGVEYSLHLLMHSQMPFTIQKLIIWFPIAHQNVIFYAKIMGRILILIQWPLFELINA